MHWLKSYHRDSKTEKRKRNDVIQKKMLSELKKKHRTEKIQEIELLKKRIEILEDELKSYE